MKSQERRDSLPVRLVRGVLAASGGIQVGKGVVEALRDPDYLTVADGTAKVIVGIAAGLIIPALIREGARAVETVFLDKT